ncbi:MAG: hypothetical protein HKN50_06945 [Gammaproteobacteria bacterium]|nr:hypothetical protein [Gammaproteobacteria bacterium]
MRFIILVILALALAYGAMQLDAIDPYNYVKFYMLGYSVELSMLGFLIALFVSVLVLYFVIWLYRLIWRAPKSVAKWSDQRNRDKAQDQLGAGYLSLIKGDWRKAEQQLTRKSDHSKVPYVNFLAAAQAAQEQGKLTERDRYLQAAYESAPKERLAIGLTKARLHQQAGQMELALATLEDIAAVGSKNPQYTAMRLQALEATEQWQEAQALLPVARKQAALPETSLDQMQEKVHLHALQQAQDVGLAWRAVPRAHKKSPALVAVYAQYLITEGEDAAAEKLIRGALKHNWSDQLIELYGQLKLSKPAKGQRRAEGWLIARPENAHLNLAAGRLAWSAKNADAAKEHLQAAIKLGQLPAAYALLGEVYEANNESGKALQLYRSGMDVASKPVPNTGTPRGITQSNESDQPDQSSADSVEQQTQKPEQEQRSPIEDARPKPA